MSSDRIEKQVVLKAPLDRVWRAISDADEFGRWFGVRFDGPFVAGTSVIGTITPTTVDEDVAKAQQPYAGQADAWQIVAVEPQRRLAFRWHPFGVEDDREYSNEPTTLVEFTLEDTSDGVLLRIVESGFDAIPAERRQSAFDSNSEGWSAQTELVRKYLALRETV
ncbi:SRPBCC family protein [Mycobacterium neglectum]|uniref:SRPBCC family protein n=1 Tax=Mycobacterium neglectum TaxID=242737 RepID=UPI000BFEBBEB|nr:SRPBCC family protein [Mycobacterium neglectum]